jgi:hypothetical protein
MGFMDLVTDVMGVIIFTKAALTVGLMIILGAAGALIWWSTIRIWTRTSRD